MRESNKALVSNGKQQCDEWLKAFWRVGYYSCYSQGRWDPQMFRMYVIFEEKCTYFNTFYHIITHFIFNLNIQNNCGWNPAKVLSSQSRIFTVLRTVGAGACKCHKPRLPYFVTGHWLPFQFQSVANLWPVPIYTDWRTEAHLWTTCLASPLHDSGTAWTNIQTISSPPLFQHPPFHS